MLGKKKPSAVVLESAHECTPPRVNSVIHINNGTPDLSQVTLESNTGTSFMSLQKHKHQKRKLSDVQNTEEDYSSEEEDSSSEEENSSNEEEDERMSCFLFDSGAGTVEGSVGVNGTDVPIDTSLSQNLVLYKNRVDSKDKIIQDLQEEVDTLKKLLDQTRNDLKMATSRNEEYVKILKNENLFLSKEEAQLVVSHSKKKVFRYIKIVTRDMKDDTLFRESVRVKQAMQILLPNAELEERLKKWFVYKSYVIKGIKEQAKQQTRNVTSRYNGKYSYCIACFNEKISNNFFV